MTKYLLSTISLFLITAMSSFGQTKVDKYCEVTLRPRALSSKSVVAISFGDAANLFNFKDSSVIVQLQKVNQYTSEVDALNYMSSLGWSLIISHLLNGNGNYNVLCFKKEFNKSELADN